jgi:hypothetical protein
MKKILVLALLAIVFAGCSKSLVKTEWIDISSDIKIEFINNDMGRMHFGNENIVIHYKYEHPRVIISSFRSSDMIGIIDGKKMTFDKDKATFIKNEQAIT